VTQPFFITEKETEEWLNLETRDLPMPDGATRPLTDFKLTWNSFDFIVRFGMFTPLELVKLAYLSTSETGFPFEETFPNVVAFIERTVRSSRGGT
jgi:hypothetical protein